MFLWSYRNTNESYGERVMLWEHEPQETDKCLVRRYNNELRTTVYRNSLYIILNIVQISSATTILIFAVAPEKAVLISVTYAWESVGIEVWPFNRVKMKAFLKARNRAILFFLSSLHALLCLVLAEYSHQCNSFSPNQFDRGLKSLEELFQVYLRWL